MTELARAAEQIEAPLASLVGDYEERDTHNSPRAKGIFLLPNSIHLRRIILRVLRDYCGYAGRFLCRGCGDS